MNRRYQHADGFTLIELSLSVAILLIIMLGLNYVFTQANLTIGAAAAAGDENRASRTVQGVLSQDFRDAVPDSPVFVISMQCVSWFQSNQDYQSTDTGQYTYNQPITGNFYAMKLDPGNTGTPTYLIPPASVNYRSHRVDFISFFIRGGPYHRQTANGGSFTSSTTSNEGWVYIGHVALPVRTSGRPGTFYPPEDDALLGKTADQVVGAYAADWVVGRVLMLLKDHATLVNNSDQYIPVQSVPGRAGSNSTSPRSAMARHLPSEPTSRIPNVIWSTLPSIL